MEDYSDCVTTDAVSYLARPGVKSGNPIIDFTNAHIYGEEQIRYLELEEINGEGELPMVEISCNFLCPVFAGNPKLKFRRVIKRRTGLRRVRLRDLSERAFCN